jgi:rubrerythrin
MVKLLDITALDWYEKNSTPDNLYICPNIRCGFPGVRENFKRCPNCGKKFNWLSKKED